jgi:hypothetical protein
MLDMAYSVKGNCLHTRFIRHKLRSEVHISMFQVSLCFLNSEFNFKIIEFIVHKQVYVILLE